MVENAVRATVTYLNHSGFAVQTAKHVLIFDDYRDGLQGGGIDPRALAQEPLTVFVSHGHYDHYNAAIFDWKKEIPHISYVLSDDIPCREPGVLLVAPEREYRLEDIRIQTLTSTDQGVAFLVFVDGLCIYHGGDLNWWHWNDEPEEENRRMAKRYQAQIDRLRGHPIDLAFVPVDPRQEENYLLGLDYFMRTVGADRVFPMHFWEDLRIFDWLQQDKRASAYWNHIVEMKNPGQQFLYERLQRDEH